MRPWIHLDTASVPDGSAELRLLRRGDEYSIMLGTNELMNSRLSGSEESLATLTCDRIQGRREPNILIGGLGMGFTLRAALGILGAEATITVAEIVPAVISWARGPLAPVFGNSLGDPRVKVVEADVGRLIRSGERAFDAILLDVDNGPDGLTRDGNDALYDAVGLRAAHRALRDGGVLSVWSSGPDAAFTKRLQRAGFAVEEMRVRARPGGGGARHVIWLATQGGARRSATPAPKR